MLKSGSQSLYIHPSTQSFACTLIYAALSTSLSHLIPGLHIDANMITELGPTYDQYDSQKDII